MPSKKLMPLKLLPMLFQSDPITDTHELGISRHCERSCNDECFQKFDKRIIRVNSEIAIK